MSYIVPSYQAQYRIQPNLMVIPPTEQSMQYASLPPIYPPLPKAPEVPYSLSRVDMMDVVQTGNWVSTLGRHMGWKEAETYAKKIQRAGRHRKKPLDAYA